MKRVLIPQANKTKRHPGSARRRICWSQGLTGSMCCPARSAPSGSLLGWMRPGPGPTSPPESLWAWAPGGHPSRVYFWSLTLCSTCGSYVAFCPLLISVSWLLHLVQKWDSEDTGWERGGTGSGQAWTEGSNQGQSLLRLGGTLTAPVEWG